MAQYSIVIKQSGALQRKRLRLFIPLTIHNILRLFFYIKYIVRRSSLESEVVACKLRGPGFDIHFILAERDEISP